MSPLAAMLAIALGLQTTDPTIPDASQAISSVNGRGVQIYRCAQQQDDQFAWTLFAPEATLFDADLEQAVGTHGRGPRWTWMDGSSISGQVVQKVDQTDNIAWLLLSATPDPSAPPGVLSAVTWVRRWNTRGGNPPPEGCDADHLGTRIRIPYAATYTFYTPQ